MNKRDDPDLERYTDDRLYTDEEIEAMLKDEVSQDEEEHGSPMYERPYIKRIVAVVLSLALVGNIFAFWPQIYSLAAIQFLLKSRELSQLEEVQQYQESVVVVRTDESKGTGFNIADDGLIVTNEHVIGEQEQIWVRFPNREMYSAEVITRDRDLDIALLDIDGANLPTLELAIEETWERGDPIYIIGNPLAFTGIANEGHLLGMREEREPQSMLLQAPVYRGNSGSPVIDQNGKVIGVVFATTKLSFEGKQEKVGLAVPMTQIRRSVDEELLQRAR